MKIENTKMKKKKSMENEDKQLVRKEYNKWIKNDTQRIRFA